MRHFNTAGSYLIANRRQAMYEKKRQETIQQEAEDMFQIWRERDLEDAVPIIGTYTTHNNQCRC